MSAPRRPAPADRAARVTAIRSNYLVAPVGFQIDSGEMARPAFAETYAVADRFIRLEAAGDEELSLFRLHFAAWHVSPAGGAGGVEPDATVKIKRGDVPSPPRGFESFDTAAGGVCHTDGRTYFFESAGSVVRVGGDAPRRVEVWIGDGPASREATALTRLVFEASITALRRCGLYELHGAGLVEPGSGAGFLFVGPSGSGKSTLAAQLASAGWRYLSDDTLLLRESGPLVEARGLRRAFAVTVPTAAAGLRGLEGLLGEPAAYDPLKRRFEPEAAFPRRFAASCLPRAVFFPSVTLEPSSRARRISQAETMSRLVRMCPWACYDRQSARAHLGVLARLARQAAGFELFAGTDLMGEVKYASDFLRRSARGEGS